MGWRMRGWAITKMKMVMQRKMIVIFLVTERTPQSQHLHPLPLINLQHHPYTHSATTQSHNHPLHSPALSTTTSTLFRPDVNTPSFSGNFSNRHSPLLVAPRYVSWLFAKVLLILPTFTLFTSTFAVLPCEKPARESVSCAASAV